MKLYGRTLPALRQGTFSLNDRQIKALEHSPSMVLITNGNGLIEYINAHFREVTGYSKSDVLGSNLDYLLADMNSGSPVHELQYALAVGAEWEGELQLKKNNSQTFHFSGKLIPLEDSFGVKNGFMLSGQNVSSFKETEELLDKTIKEKSMLLAELHHRVKNNLAIVSGLMQLQALNENDLIIRNKLFESAGRVSSMASMHEVLYESDSLINIDVMPIINKIILAVENLYKPNSQLVDIDINVETVSLNINQAHPFSLILNEVLTNAYKFALKGDDGDTIAIHVTQKDNQVEITIRHNGIGIPVDYKKDSANSTKKKNNLGYELLNTMVRQLVGNYTYTSHGAETFFHLQFMKGNTFGASNGKLTEEQV